MTFMVIRVTHIILAHTEGSMVVNFGAAVSNAPFFKKINDLEMT